MPVPVLVGSWATIEGLTSSVSQRTWDLVEAFWPGGLTLIVEHAPSLTWDLGDARGTVGLRMPLHPVAIELLEITGPMAVSSANISGQPPAGEAVSVYLDGGPAAAQVASTIVDVTAEVPRVVRSGAIGLDEIRAVVPDVVG
jgi:tRNA threonylcarbamoyl adenosine modification protein (Sua5/YciO/YrdC/YwlC family)